MPYNRADITRFWKQSISKFHTCSIQYNDTSALTPDGGLINGVGALSRGKHLKATTRDP